ncbi:MAG: DUF2971 domain-containing protein [candidate division Zixibacteria bacterium]
MTDNPDILYKYRDWHVEKHRRILSHNKIFFTSARNFNDPFDGTIPLRYDKGSRQEISDKYSDRINKDNPNLNRIQKRDLAKKWRKKGLLRNRTHIKMTQDMTREQLFNDFGIFSLSAECLNILLWTHYSNSHRGFCVGFDMQKLDNMRNDPLYYADNLIDIHKVEYEIDYPLFNPYKMDDEEITQKPLITKSSAWSYENEYRLILFDKTNVEIDLLDEIIAEVYLGCKISPEDKEQIIDALQKRKNRPELFITKMQENSFGLIKESIDY